MRAPRRLFSRLRPQRFARSRRLLAIGMAMASCGFAEIRAADPYLDADGYYWSSTEKDDETPVIWDRADLRFYTDGTWRWSIVDNGRTLEKIGSGEFYQQSNNQGLNELAQAVATMRAANGATEAALEQSLRQSVRPADQAAAERFEALIGRLRRGEKGDDLRQAFAEFVAADQAKKLLDDRDKARQTAFDDVEKLYQRQRLNMAMASARPVRTMIVSERSLRVPGASVGNPLETDDGPAGYSEAMGFPFRLVPAGNGNYFAIVQNKPQPGSAADQLQLLMGDAVTAVNDQPIRTVADLERMTQPQTIVTVAKQLDGNPVRQVVDFYPPGTVPPNQAVPPGYQPLPPGYRYVR